MGYVVIACRALLGLVFLVSVVSKTRSRAAFSEFAATMRKLPVVRARAANKVAVAVVAAETAVVLALAAPAPAAVGFILAAAVLTVLTLGIAATMRSGAAVPCRCFGASGRVLGKRHLARNSFLLVVAAAGAVGGLAAPEGATHLSGAAIALVTAVMLATLVIVLDDIVDLFIGPPVAGGQSRNTRA